MKRTALEMKLLLKELNREFLFFATRGMEEEAKACLEVIEQLSLYDVEEEENEITYH